MLMCMALLACKGQAEQRVAAKGTVADRQFAVSDFDELDIKCKANVTVEFVQGNSCEVTARAAGEVLDDVKMTVRNGELNVRYGNVLPSLGGGRPDIRLTVKAPRLRELSAQGVTVFNCKSLEQLQDFEAELSGKSVLNIGSLKCGKLETDISGVSSLCIEKAVCSEVDLDACGFSTMKGDYEAARSVDCDFSGKSRVSVSVKAAEVDIDAGGLSDIACSVSCDRLELDLSGKSNVVLEGSAGSVRKTVTGAASLSTGRLKTVF